MQTPSCLWTGWKRASVSQTAWKNVLELTAAAPIGIWLCSLQSSLMITVPLGTISSLSRQVLWHLLHGWGGQGMWMELMERCPQSGKDVKVLWCEGWGKVQILIHKAEERHHGDPGLPGCLEGTLPGIRTATDHFKKLLSCVGDSVLDWLLTRVRYNWIKKNPVHQRAMTVRPGESEVCSLPLNRSGLRGAQSQFLPTVMLRVSGRLSVWGCLIQSPVLFVLHQMYEMPLSTN